MPPPSLVPSNGDSPESDPGLWPAKDMFTQGIGEAVRPDKPSGPAELEGWPWPWLRLRLGSPLLTAWKPTPPARPAFSADTLAKTARPGEPPLGGECELLFERVTTEEAE